MESDDRTRLAFAKICGGTSTFPPPIREFITPIQCENEPLVTDLLDDLYYYRFRQNPETTIKQVLSDEGFPDLSGESVLRLLSRELEQKHALGVWTRRLELDEQFPHLRSFFANKLDGYDKDEFSSLSDWLIPDLSNTKYDDVQFFSFGGQSTIFNALDTVLERRVLLKCPRSPGVFADESSATPLERLHREAQILATLEHPNVTTVHDLVTSKCGRLMLVMPKYARTTLRNLISDFHSSEQGKQRFRSDAFSELLRHLETICSAAAYAHDAEIIHRDLKPNNVLVDEFDQTVVIDWGLARRLTEIEQEGEFPEVSEVSSPKTETQPVGTHGYIAPEIEEAPQSASSLSDIFSIGVILRDMIHCETGDDDSQRTSVPRSLQAMCDQATNTDPTERYATASEFRADLVTWQEFGKPIALKSETAFEYIERFSRKHPSGVIAFALLSPLFLSIAIYAQLARSTAEQAQIDLVDENAKKTEAIERLERGNYLNTINFRQTRFVASGEVFNSERIGSGEVSKGAERFKSFEWHFFERKLAGAPRTIGDIYTNCTGTVVTMQGKELLAGSAVRGLQVWSISGWPLQTVDLPGKPSVRRIQTNEQRSIFGVLHAAVSAPATTISILDQEYKIIGSHDFESEIEQLVFTRDNACIAFCTRNGEIGQYSLRNDSISVEKLSENQLFCIATMSDSQVAAGGYEVLVYDTFAKTVISSISKQQLNASGFLFCRNIVFDAETNRLFVNAIGKNIGLPNAELFSAILVVDVNESLEVTSTIQFRQRIECLAPNENGSIIVGTDDGKMHRLNCRTLEQSQFPDSYGTVYCTDVYDGKLYWGTNEGRIQESAQFASEDVIRKIPTNNRHTVFDVSRDQKYLWSCNRSHSSDPLILWHLEAGHVANCVPEFEVDAEHVEFSQSGTLSLVVGKKNGKGKLIVWKTHSFPPKTLLSTSVADTCNATFLNESHIAFVTSPRQLVMRNLENGVESITDLPADIVSLQGGADLLVVATTDEDMGSELVVFSDIVGPKRNAFHIKVRARPTCVASSIDGELVACGFVDGAVDVLLTKTAERVATVKFEYPGKVTCCQFTSDGLGLGATVEAPPTANTGRLSIWDTELWSLRASYDKRSGSPSRFKFSSDCQTLYTNSDERTLQIWNPNLPQPRFDTALVLRPKTLPKLELVNAELKPDGEFKGAPRYQVELEILNASDAELNSAHLYVQNYMTNRKTADRVGAGGRRIDEGVISPGRTVIFKMPYYHHFRTPLEQGYSSFVVEIRSSKVDKEDEVLATSEILLSN